MKTILLWGFTAVATGATVGGPLLNQINAADAVVSAHAIIRPVNPDELRLDLTVGPIWKGNIRFGQQTLHDFFQT
ncbi:MAG: hypothetical protein ABSH09_26285 [Bryobacteraceae bacterium]|jgi:hypothetical protein